jgi:hypothetical protein
MRGKGEGGDKKTGPSQGASMEKKRTNTGKRRIGRRKRRGEMESYGTGKDKR